MFTRKILVIFVLSVFYISGCNESSITNGVPGQSNSFSIPVWDYSDYHYLIDTSYKRSFLEVMNDSTGNFSNETLNKKIKYDFPSFQIWVQCDITEPLKRLAVAYIYLPDTTLTIRYNRLSYPRNKNAIDTAYSGYFRQLNTNEYYIDPIAGFIGLSINIPENYALALAYETYNGKKFGLGKYDITVNDTMVLNLIKCANQSPFYTPRAWELKMKNVYRLPYKDISQQNFYLGVKYYYNQIYNDYLPGIQIPLNQILLIDRYTNCNKYWQPDGKFDWCPNRTIIPETGDVIFPTLYPFRDEISKFVIDTNLIFSEIYTQSKLEAQHSIKSNNYHIRGYTDTLK